MVLLLKLLIDLLYSMGKSKDPLDQVVYPSGYFHSAVLLYTYQYYNKTKCTFEPYICYCHLHLACMSIRYKRKLHGINYSKVIICSKTFSFVLILLKYELDKNFLHPNFPDLRYVLMHGVSFQQSNSINYLYLCT